MRFKLYKLGNTSKNNTGGNCACLHGTPYIDASGNCHCTAHSDGKTYKPTRTAAQIDYANPRVIDQAIQNALNQYQAGLPNTTKTPVNTTPVIDNGFDAKEFFQNNKLLVLAGAGALAFFAFSAMGGGGKFAGKTRTEVTRWGGA